MKQQEAEGIAIYPNPSNNYFTINVSATPALKGALSDNGYSLVVRDVIGRVVYQKENISSDESFNFGEMLSGGIYVAEIKQGDDRKVIRLIKNN